MTVLRHLARLLRARHPTGHGLTRAWLWDTPRRACLFADLRLVG
jgi:hypothetical protein